MDGKSEEEGDSGRRCEGCLCDSEISATSFSQSDLCEKMAPLVCLSLCVCFCV